jgi:TonB family protein
MKWHDLQNSCKGQRRIAKVIMQLAVLATAMAIAMPLRAADEHTERAIKQRVAPTYPELAKRMRISGVVRVSATVAPDGSVSATKAVSGNHMLSGAAEEAVHKWKFVPASDESTIEVEVNFALAQ